MIRMDFSRIGWRNGGKPAVKVKKMEAREALERGLTLPFAWIRTLSAVALGPVPEAVDTTELLEARFFDRQEEIRLFQADNGLEAVCLTAETGDRTMEEERKLLSHRFGEYLTVCHTLAFDDDGQAYIAETRLTDWKGGGV